MDKNLKILQKSTKIHKKIPPNGSAESTATQTSQTAISFSIEKKKERIKSKAKRKEVKMATNKDHTRTDTFFNVIALSSSGSLLSNSSVVSVTSDYA